jgi:hypothetical protein
MVSCAIQVVPDALVPRFWTFRFRFVAASDEPFATVISCHAKLASAPPYVDCHFAC